MTVVISFRSVTASGSGGLLVDGLSFDAGSATVTAVLAVPAASRDAIARLANGIDRPSKGTVMIDGIDVHHGHRLKRRRTMGWVKGPVTLFPHRTVSEQVAMSARLGGVGRRGSTLEAQAALTRLGVGMLAGRYPHELSRAEQLRVALARAIVHNPDVIVMVDPFEGLEPPDRVALRAVVAELQREQRRTVLLVSADHEDAVQLGDSVVVVVDGRLMQVATPAELLERPFDTSVATLIGENRGLRRLAFATIDALEPDDRPIVPQAATAAAARFVARPSSPWVLVVDDDRRAVGWLDTSRLPAEGNATDVPLIRVSDDVALDGDSIGAVLDRILSSPARLVARLSGDGRVIGVFSQTDLAGVAAEAMTS